MTSVSFLLVDDLEENLLSLEALLRRDGLNVLKARSGDQALELLLQHDVALALIDVQMPGLNGFELAELMRGNERTRRVPIIFVTAGSTDERRRFQGYEAGAVDFIQKPIEPDILRSKAEVFFELYRQRLQLQTQRDQLQIQAEALKDADRRKDEFLATLAHELRNPLAPLRHGLDILRKNPDSENASEIRDMMDRQLRHLVRLIDDLMDVSRVSQGKIELRNETIEVSAIIDSAVEASRPSIDGADHIFELVIPTEKLWIEADPTRLSQVVSNLLNNAAKYTPSGGKIKLEVTSTATEAVIQVSDNGVGIPADLQGDVFQLFAQVGEHRDQSQGGLGIGLALVKQLLDLHQGSVAVESRGAGQGSVFTVRLPLVAAPEPRLGSGTAVAEAARSAPLKVLIVDDNALIADTLGWMLEEIGHEYSLAYDGPSALETAKHYQPDAILMDIGLPVMDGYDVCRAFRQDERFKTTPIIAQTGWGQQKDKAMAADAGFDHHLTKPIMIDDLAKLLSGIGTRS
jgi:signal transduction histidine kinase